MSDQVALALIFASIGPVIGLLGTLTVVFLQYRLYRKDRMAFDESLKQQAAKHEDKIQREKERYDALEKNYHEALKRHQEIFNGKQEHSQRKISFQLEALKDKICKLENLGQTPRVWVLGVNALGPLHQGRELFINLLKKGGTLRVLLLDPAYQVFQKRSDDEHDHVGRITAEMFAAFYILMDILSQLTPEVASYRDNLQVRLHQEYPDRSLIIINAEDTAGMALANRYPK